MAASGDSRGESAGKKVKFADSASTDSKGAGENDDDAEEFIHPTPRRANSSTTTAGRSSSADLDRCINGVLDMNCVASRLRTFQTLPAIGTNAVLAFEKTDRDPPRLNF